MKKNHVFFLFLLAFVNVCAQNLIPNPGFETASACPTTISQISFAPSWNNGSNTDYGSPEFYTNGGACNFLPPNNGQGAGTANSGNGLSGIFCYRTIALNREYLVAPLSVALTPGTNYTLSYYVRKSSQSRYSIDEIGAYFSTTAPACLDVSAPCSAASVLMPVTPQLKTTVGVFPNNTWQQVIFTITATAAWQYVSIGNFDTDAATGTFNFGSGSNFAYLLFDDFVLAETSTLSINTNYFQSNCSANKNKVSWEFSNSNFGQVSLESSLDAILFEEKQSYVANGQTSFEFYDEFSEEKKYYRLKQIDDNGNVNYSNILTANNCAGQVPSVNIFPNPTSDFVKVENAPEGSIIQVYDVMGRIVKSVSTQDGAIELIDVFNFAEGVYIVSITYKGELICKNKILKSNLNEVTK